MVLVLMLGTFLYILLGLSCELWVEVELER